MSFVIQKLQSYQGRKIKIMEVCGTHTSSIFKNGIRDLISPQIELISGPGCPVCVTKASYIDELIQYAHAPNTVVLTFGDMMKVKGTRENLTQTVASGGKVEILYSPLMAIERAVTNPETEFIFAAVGFETTLPIYGLLLEEITKRELQNLKLLTATKKMMPALEYICQTATNIDGFLCPGHVSVITGSDCFEKLCKTYQKPFVVAGFEGEHILVAIYEILQQIEQDQPQVTNCYTNAVSAKGNEKAQKMMERFFETKDGYWRGIGWISNSEFVIRKEYQRYCANLDQEIIEEKMPDGCQCANVILGQIQPSQCPLFGSLCTPEDAVGPCMVSAEGVCGIWYKNRRNR